MHVFTLMCNILSIKLKLFPFQSNKIDDHLKLEAEMELKDLHQPKRKLTPWKHQRLGYVF